MWQARGELRGNARSKNLKVTIAGIAGAEDLAATVAFKRIPAPENNNTQRR